MKKVQVTITHKVTRMYPNRFNTYFSMTSPFLSVKTDRIPIAVTATPVYGPLLVFHESFQICPKDILPKCRNGCGDRSASFREILLTIYYYSKEANLNSSGTPIGWLIRFLTLDFVRTAEPLWYTGATTASSSTSFFSALSISSRRTASSV